MRSYTLPALLLAAGLAVAGCGGAVSSSQPQMSDSPEPAASSSAPEPAPEPSPDGTFTGSCDYTLPMNMDGDYKLIGDVEATNRGNVGIKVRVTIRWRQTGYKPVTDSKTLRVDAGAVKVARFNKTVSPTVIDRVQTYQMNHMGDPLCTYKGVMLDTFGEPQQ